MCSFSPNRATYHTNSHQLWNDQDVWTATSFRSRQWNLLLVSLGRWWREVPGSCLRYMTYRALGETIRARRAVEEMIYIIKKKIRYYRETTLNILGWVLKDKGHTARAVECFQRSLEIQTTFNTAEVSVEHGLDVDSDPHHLWWSGWTYRIVYLAETLLYGVEDPALWTSGASE